jgi:dUTP pyrophosphatase
MKVKIKKLHKNAVIPEYAKNGDAGLDLVAVSVSSNELYIEYDTGLAMEIPEGHVGLIFPRSSISKYHLSMANSVGVVDSGYRGSVTVRFKRVDEGWWTKYYEVGDKIAQLVIMPYPQVELVEVTDLSETERGAGGYGSSGT